MRVAEQNPKKARMPDFLTPEEAAEYLRISRATLVAEARRGRIPGTKIAGKWRFSRRLLRRWAEQEGEDQALLKALEEAAADPNNQERIPLEQVRRELGL